MWVPQDQHRPCLEKEIFLAIHKSQDFMKELRNMQFVITIDKFLNYMRKSQKKI